MNGGLKNLPQNAEPVNPPEVAQMLEESSFSVWEVNFPGKKSALARVGKRLLFPLSNKESPKTYNAGARGEDWIVERKLRSIVMSKKILIRHGNALVIFLILLISENYNVFVCEERKRRETMQVWKGKRYK
ncbi:hypothetical protein TIFTF001_026695 [Ficus carica]|uniref:Uncharacterized protein n=1 Tax=Ficus carica TaxID=3494 RepID=A0AA88DLN1_FICCA|nr:hypothetical protein TIFTF001_026695 [Ficus carica]